MSHAGPTEPELPPEDDDDELLLDELLVPLDPLLDELLVPLDPPLLDAPVSGFVAASVAGAPLSSVTVVFAGSVVVLLPASVGAGSAVFVSSTALPTESTGDVAHAEARAKTDSAATAMRLERRMAGTLAAELCTLPERHTNETLR